MSSGSTAGSPSGRSRRRLGSRARMAEPSWPRRCAGARSWHCCRARPPGWRAAPLGMPVEAVADGAIRVANALMAAEASNVLARRGVDAPRFRMVAFGGAGPLVAALLAEEIGIDAILIPPFPGGLSALGAARADLEGDLVEPVYERLGALDQPALARVTANLQARAAARIAGPAIVNQMDTTTWIPEGWTARVVPSGALVLERS